MTSEIENILKGKIEATVDYNTSKKIIGISTSNLTPNENGIAPLEKQGAFQQIESLDLTEAINSAQSQEADPVVETLDLPVLDEKEQNTQVSSELKIPQTSDVIMKNPVQVESPEKLDGFAIPEISVETPVENVTEINEPVAIDIQMPTMPETIVANEPETLDENIFEGIVNVEQQKSILETETINEHLEEVILPAENVALPVENNQQEELNLLEETAISNSKIEETSVPTEATSTENNVAEETNIQNSVVLPEIKTEENVEQGIKEEQNVVPEIIDIDKILEEQKNSIISNFDNIKTNLSSLIESIDKAKIDVEEAFNRVKQEVNKIEQMESKIKEQIMPVTEEIQNLSNQGNILVDDAIDRINAMAGNGLTM